VTYASLFLHTNNNLNDQWRGMKLVPSEPAARPAVPMRGAGGTARVPQRRPAPMGHPRGRAFEASVRGFWQRNTGSRH